MEWRRNLPRARKRAEQVRVTRTRDDKDDLLIFRPIFANPGDKRNGERKIALGKMKRRKANRRPVVQLFSYELQDEGIAIIAEEFAPRGFDHEYLCQFCVRRNVFGSKQGWE